MGRGAGSSRRRGAKTGRPASKKARKDNIILVDGKPTVISENSFETLSNHSDMGEEMPPPKFIPQRRQQTVLVDSRPHPIIIKGSTINTAQDLLSTPGLRMKGWFEKRSDHIRIQMECKDDKKKLLDIIKQREIQHHTFTEKDERLPVYVLKHHHLVTTDELLTLLKAENIPALKTFIISPQNENDNPVYLVQFEKDSIKLPVLQHVHKLVNRLKIKWEKYRPSDKKITQCRRCQAFGHSASNCGYKYRCVKCLNSHEPGQCPRKTRDDFVACVNCGKMGHPSSSNKCVVYQTYVDKIQKSKQKQTLLNPVNSNSQIQKNLIKNSVNFPQLAPTSSNSNQQSSWFTPISSSQQQSRKMSFAEELASLQKEFTEIPDMQEVLSSFRNLIFNLKNASSKEQKLQILIAATCTMN